MGIYVIFSELNCFAAPNLDRFSAPAPHHHHPTGIVGHLPRSRVSRAAAHAFVSLDSMSQSPPTLVRPSSKNGLRRASRPPSLNTVWEWDGHSHVDAVPATDDAMQEGSGNDEPMRGLLALRSGPSWLRLFARGWESRYAVLQPATGSSPARLMLFLTDSMETLHEELLLLSPLQLQCLPYEGVGGDRPARFTISAADATPIELAAKSEKMRDQWIYSLGER